MLGVGIANFNTNAGVVLSPNPSNGIFSLTTNTNKLITASIYSLEGKLLKTFDGDYTLIESSLDTSEDTHKQLMRLFY